MLRAVGRTGLTPTQWTKFTIIPLYEKGDATKASNHRPIALLSHARKVLEKVLDNAIHAEFDFDPAKLGFRRHQGTEIAILPANPLPTLSVDYIAVPDLKQAYTSGHKDKLLEQCREELTSNLLQQLEHMLKQRSFRTVGDDSEAVAVCGFKWRKAQWWRKAFKLQPVTYRRARLRDNLRSKLSREQRPQLCILQYALTRARNLDVWPELETLWNRAVERKMRHLPLPSGNSLIPVLYCSNNKHRALGLQWYIHSPVTVQPYCNQISAGGTG